jgi:hypothetical protein
MDKSQHFDDQRSNPRLDEEIAIHVQRLAYPLADGTGEAGKIKNISQDGICLMIPSAYAAGTLLGLKIHWPGWQRHKDGVAGRLDDAAATAPLTAVAEVVWCRNLPNGGGFEIGIRFRDIYEDDYKAFIRYLKIYLASGSTASK